MSVVPPHDGDRMPLPGLGTIVPAGRARLLAGWTSVAGGLPLGTAWQGARYRANSAHRRGGRGGVSHWAGGLPVDGFPVVWPVAGKHPSLMSTYRALVMSAVPPHDGGRMPPRALAHLSPRAGLACWQARPRRRRPATGHGLQVACDGAGSAHRRGGYGGVHHWAGGLPVRDSPVAWLAGGLPGLGRRAAYYGAGGARRYGLRGPGPHWAGGLPV